MSRKHHRKRSGKTMEYIFIGSAIALVVLLAALIIIPKVTGNDGIVITEDGHVHDAAGNHLGNYDELFGDGGYVLTEDGHIHDAAGNHIADAADLTEETTETETTETETAEGTVEAPAAE